MIRPGLVSVTFRRKTPLEICRLCERADLRAIEWGADVHVPPRSRNLPEIRCMNGDHGLFICSYGSYWRLTQPLDELQVCMDAALMLGTDTVRIWGGIKGSREAEAQRSRLIEKLLICAEEARARSLTLALEYHGGTLTDSRQSVRQLMAETSSFSDCLRFHWQPRFDWTHRECLASFSEVLPRLSHLHTFTWEIKNGEILRLPLSDGEKLWKTVLSACTGNHCALLEFIKNDSEEQFLRDAAALHRWINDLGEVV